MSAAGEAWQDRARARGWSETDIDGLVSLIAMAREPQEVVRVDRWLITVRTRVVYRFEGTDRTGAVVPTEVVRENLWHWRKTELPTSSIARPADPDAPSGCVLHGPRCAARSLECGFMARSTGVVSLQRCGCGPRRHVPGCEVQARDLQERLDAFARSRIAARRASEEPEPPRTFVPPRTKTRKPTKKNGWKIPGHPRLPLGTKTG